MLWLRNFMLPTLARFWKWCNRYLDYIIMLRTSLRPTDLRPCVLLYIIQLACTQVWCIYSSRQCIRTQTYNTCWNRPDLIQTPSFTTAFPDTGSESGCCSLVIQQFVSTLLYMVRICACIWRTLSMYVNYEYTLTYIRKIESCVMSQMYYVYVVIRILNSAYPNTHAYKCIERFD